MENSGLGMETRSIRIEADYQAAQGAIDALLSAEAGAPETGQLEVLSLLAQAWEDEHYPVGYPDEIEAILCHMEQNELGGTDLEPAGRGWRTSSAESDP